ncbi:hypothetical protein UlMin_019884 [Ulmus minor]
MSLRFASYHDIHHINCHDHSHNDNGDLRAVYHELFMASEIYTTNTNDLGDNNSEEDFRSETNDIFTKKDGEFLVKHGALPEERIHAVEIGVCPHGRILEDININLGSLEELCNLFKVDILLYEYGGDVSSGDKTPRKGGPGITQADILVINKTDLAPTVGVDLGIMERDALCIRDGSSFFLLKFHGQGVEEFTGIGSCNQEIVTIILLKVLILCIGLFIYLFLFQLFL